MREMSIIDLCDCEDFVGLVSPFFRPLSPLFTSNEIPFLAPKLCFIERPRFIRAPSKRSGD